MRDGEARFRQTFDLAGFGIAHLAPDGRFLRANRRLCELFGCDEAELLGRSVESLLHPDDAHLSGGERRYLRKDGSLLWAVLTRAHDIAIIEDVGERRRAEAVLRQSEERFRGLVELSSDWYWEQDADMRFTMLQGPALGGMPAAQAIGRTPEELTGVEPVGGTWQDHLAAIRMREPFRAFEYSATAPDGAVQYIEVSGEPVYDAGGAFRGYRGLGKDITARKRAELERQKTGRMYAALGGLAELLARAQTAQELLQGACELAVASGDFDLAAVRMLQSGTEPAPIVAIAGPHPAAWLERPVDVSEGAAGAFPLRQGGRCVATMLVRGGDPGGCEGEIRTLLERMAAAMSRGLDALDAAHARRRFRLALDNSADMIVLCDRATLRLVDVNNTVCRLLGYTREEMIGAKASQFLLVSDDELARAYDEMIADPSRKGGLQSFYRCKDGSLLPFESTRHVLREGNRWLVAAISRDTRERDAERARAGAALKASEQRFRALIEHGADGILVCDAQARIVYRSPSAGRITGYADDQRTGRDFAELVLADDQPAVRARFVAAMAHAGRTEPLQHRMRRKDGAVRWVEGTLTNMLDEPAVAGLVVNFRDVTDRVQAEEEARRRQQRIEHLATHDALTGLPNRTILRDRVEQAIVHARRAQGHAALMFVDLDQFKLVNDSWGHQVGDALLVEVGRRLARTVREGDTVTRLGGDEFVILLTDLVFPGDTAIVARKIAGALAEPMQLEEREVRVTASIGISLYPGDGDDLDTLLQCADAAMYRAKESGRNAYQYYGAEMGAQARARVETETGLRQALERGHLQLHYQPQVDLVTGEIRGFEALLRWQHPERGMVSPASFISIAEESGLIVPIGQWALHEACRQAAEWSAQGFGAIKVAVNLSARQFWRGGVTEVVRSALAESGLAAAQLELEITESVVARDLKQVTLSLEQLRRMGVTVAIDDFGTGYSSLAYLRLLPIQKLKIDKSFIAATPDDPDASALVAEIVRLAHVLSLEVVAEGVETQPQAAFLRGAGCEAMQGYLFARPMPGDDCAALLRAGRRLGSTSTQPN